MKRALAGLLVVIFTGCSGAAPSPSASLPAGLAAPTPWQAEMGNLEPDGTRSLDSALTLFAMAFGPIPGVQAERAAVGTVGSASPAVRVVRELRDQLTDEQAAAIDQHLAVPEDARRIDLPSVPTSRTASLSSAIGGIQVAATLPPFDPFERDLRELGERARSRAAFYFGDLPNLPDGSAAVAIRTMNAPGEPFLSFFNPTFGESGFRCDVIVNRAHEGTPMGQFARSLTLEVTHCFQSWRMGSEQGFDGNVPAWAWDGAAEYVMLESVPIQDDDVQWWATYLLLPDVPLFERSYDAVGYYTQAWEAGLDLGAVFVAVLTDVDNPERFALAGTTSNGFLDKWASELALVPEWSPEWHFIGPGQPGSIKPPRQSMSVAHGSLEAFSQDAYSNHLFAIHSTADIMIVDAFGRARIGDGTVNSVINGSAAFCTTDKGCGPCPDGSEPNIQPTRLSPDSVLGVSGGTDGTNGTVSGHRLEEFCLPTPTPTVTPSPTPSNSPEPDPDPCDSGCPMSNGDPHIVTIDDDSYDFMAAGEFVLLRNGDGTFELQARQEPYEGSNTVSINTALAMRVGTSRVGIYADTASDALNVTVDGNLADPSQPIDVAGGRIARTGEGLEVRFPDGTQLFAVGQYQYGISVTIIPGQALRETAAGLMGPVQPDSLGVPALPDGTVLPEAFGTDEYHEQLYGPFEEAWRITSDTSLFDYAPGSSTDTYTRPDFPVEDDIQTMDDFSPDQISAAAAECAGLNNEILTLQCIFDVIVTGDLGFADVYEQTATIVDTGSLVPSGQRVRVVNFYSNDTGPAAIDVYSWSDTGAALVATVAYGASSAWFEPGVRADGGVGDVQLSFQRQGETPNAFALNLYDLDRDAEPGSEKTLVLSTDSEDQFGMVEGRQMSIAELYEVSPVGFPLMDAPPDGALVFINVQGMIHTNPGVTFFTGDGSGCLGQPGFDGLAQLSGVTGESGGVYYQGPLAIEPGASQLTLHPGSQSDDPFAVTCDSPPIHGPVPYEIGAGERTHLLLYSRIEDQTIQSLLLPFGDPKG